jgi:hypothetical protein
MSRFFDKIPQPRGHPVVSLGAKLALAAALAVGASARVLPAAVAADMGQAALSPVSHSPVVLTRSSCGFDPSLLTSNPALVPATAKVYILVNSTEQAQQWQATITAADQARATMGLPPLDVTETVIEPGDAGDELLAFDAQVQEQIAQQGPTSVCVIDERSAPGDVIPVS